MRVHSIDGRLRPKTPAETRLPWQVDGHRNRVRDAPGNHTRKQSARIRNMKTTTTTTILVITAALAAGASAFAQGRNGRGAGLSAEERAALRAERERIVAMYDEDGDGKLDAVEREVLFEDIEAGKIEVPAGFGPRGGKGRQGPPPEILDQYDADGDGVLNAEERDALHADIEAGVVPPPPGRCGENRRMGPPPEILEQFDVDGDGVLSPAEHEALRDAIKAGEIEPPMRGHGPRGRGRAPAADEAGREG
ncbi:MAG: hypothetical protein D6781_04945 [Verrucomicrobia bacterium]|nr:MAG: hypothetical protein D6781_04945 [Verrucomicrobiota bacterium]